MGASDLVINPSATIAPPSESYRGESSGTTYEDQPNWHYQDDVGNDTLDFVSATEVRLGFRDSAKGDHCRIYIGGVDRYTLVELAIGSKKNDYHVKFFTIGWERVNFFSMQGDKVRFYLTPRCGEPWIYNVGQADGDPGVAPAANSPRECKVLDTGVLPGICLKWG